MIVTGFSYMEKQLDSKIVMGLERIAEVFKVLLWEEAKQHGLSPIQIQILIFIKQHSIELANVTYLSKEFNLTKPTVSDAIRILLKKGIIHKIPSPTDKRAYSIALTEQGKALVESLQNFSKPLEKYVTELSLETKTDFFKTLTHLIFQLNKSNVITVQRMCFSCHHYEKRQDKENQHFCKLLQTQLTNKNIQLDCPEFQEKI